MECTSVFFAGFLLNDLSEKFAVVITSYPNFDFLYEFFCFDKDYILKKPN